MTLRILSVLIVLSLALAGCGEEEVEEVTPVVEVTQGPLVFRGSFYGELQAAERESIHVPELRGVDYLTIESVKDDGTLVKEGDVVLTFVRGPLEDELLLEENGLAIALAEEKRLKLQMEKERIDLALDVERKKLARERAELFVVEGVNLISKLELEKYQIDVDKAALELDLARKALRTFSSKRKAALEIQKLKVDAAQRKVDEKKENLKHMEVKAPSPGVLYGPYTRLNWTRGKATPGAVCRPGDKLLEIPDLTRFEAHLHVRQRDASLIKMGAQALVYPSSSPEKAIKAKVLRKEDFATTRNERLGTKTAEGNLKEILVVLLLEEALENMRPGGTVRADLKVNLAEDAVQIPIASLLESKGTYSVKMDDGSERSITPGLASTTHVVVNEGLEPGEKVRLSSESARYLVVEEARSSEEAASGPSKKGKKGKKTGKRKEKRPSH